MAIQISRKQPARLLIVDQNFQEIGGHYAEYTLAVARAARGADIAPVVFANRRCKVGVEKGIELLPIFRNTWTVAQRSQPAPELSVSSAFDPWPFYADLNTALDEVQASAADHLFIHTVGFIEVEDILRLLMLRPPQDCPLIHLLLRRDPDEVEVDPHLRDVFYRSLRAFEHLGFLGEKLRLYTDTPELTAAYGELTGLAFTTVPIPFDQELMEQKLADAAARPRCCITVGYLGDARPEKGYQFIPALVDALAESHLQTGALRFLLQSNFNLPGGEPGIAEARAQLDRYSSSQVELILDPLDPEEYYQRLAEIDILLVPYLAHRYTKRSSGIFTQAVAAGRVVVVPDGTSMSNVLHNQPAEAGLVYSTPDELVSCTIQAIETLAARQQVTARTRHNWCAEHAAHALVQTLVRPVPQTRPRAPLVLVLLDGDSLVARTGAGAVQSNQLAYLRAVGYRTAGVCMFRTFPTPEHYPELLRATGALWQEHGLGFAWMSHQLVPFAERAAGFATELARNADLSIPDTLAALSRRGSFDAVLVNYAVGLPYLDALRLPADTPVAVETHDIQSVQHAMGRNQLVDPLEYANELKTLSRADTVIALNPVEGVRLRADLPDKNVVTIIPGNFELPVASFDLAGVQDLAELVSSAGSDLDFVDFSQAELTGQTWQMERLRQACSIDLLYVSSIHPPNLRGFQWFFDKVFRPHLAPRGITLLVAGTFSKTPEMMELARHYPDQVFLAGRVSSLRPLYAAARVVLMPVFNGAGINIKAIEALCLGKPVAATTYALRGLGIGANELPRHDEPEPFAQHILHLLADPATRRAASQASLRAAGERRSRYQYFSQLDGVFSGMLGNRALATPAGLASEHLAAPFIEWDAVRTGSSNRLLRRLMEERALDMPLAHQVAAMTAEPEEAAAFEGAVYALLVDLTARLYRSQAYVRNAARIGVRFASALEAFWAFVLRATPLEALPLITPATLGGCQNLGEVLSACGSDADFVDIERAYATQSLDRQFTRAEQAGGLELAILAADATGGNTPGMVKAIVEFVEHVFLPHLAPLRFRLAIIGDIQDALPADPQIFLTGRVRDPAPALAAAQMLVAPFDIATRWDASAVQASLGMLAAGKPMLGWRDAGAALRQDGAWIFEATDTDNFVARAKQLRDDTSTRYAAATEAAAAFAAALRRYRGDDRAVIDRLQATSGLPARLAEGEPVEWNGSFVDLGRLLNHIARGERPTAKDIDTIAREWLDSPRRQAAAEILDVVCRLQTAPLQRTSYLAFRGAAPSRLARAASPQALVRAANALTRVVPATFQGTELAAAMRQAVGA